MIEMFCICTGPYNRQCGLSTCNVASVTEEMNSEFYLPDVAMATILDSAVLIFKCLLHIGHSPLYAFELVNIHQMSDTYNAILTNTAFRITV